jgi:hypothetical protein
MQLLTPLRINKSSVILVASPATKHLPVRNQRNSRQAMHHHLPLRRVIAVGNKVMGETETTEAEEEGNDSKPMPPMIDPRNLISLFMVALPVLSILTRRQNILAPTTLNATRYQT